MKKNILIALGTVILFSCAPKIGSKITSSQQPLSKNTQILVLNEFDNQEIKGIKIGKISSRDNGFSVNCSYIEIIEPLKSLAREKGANLIKIRHYKRADFWSTCDRVFADIYKVDTIAKYEKEIFWSADRPLNWNDFKAKPKIKSNLGASAMTRCGFGFQTNRITIFKNANFSVQNTFDCYSSWVDPQHSGNMELLKHEQGHFDISEIYKRKLETKLNEKKYNITNLTTLTTAIFNRINEEFLEKQEAYDSQTEHGSNTEKQKEWNSFIELSLK